MKIRIAIALGIVYLIWGSTYLAIRFAVDTIPPFIMVGWRFLIAGILLYSWRIVVKDRPPTRVEWRSAAIVGVFLIVGGTGLLAWAEQSIDSGIAAILVGTSPIWMVLIDLFRPGGQKLTWITISGVLLGFIGIIILIDPVSLLDNSRSQELTAVLFLLLAAFSWSIGSIYNRDAQLPDSSLLGTGMEMIVGGAVCLLIGIVFGEWQGFEVAAITPQSIAGFVYLIIFGSLVAFVAYTWLLRVAPTPLVSTYAYVNPLVAIFLGSMLAGEQITTRILISTFVIVSAVALIISQRESKPETISHFEPTQIRGDD
ncbi:EamA family transporter [Chloroflexota bacterium]